MVPGRTLRSYFTFAALLVALTLGAPPAFAQTHWDGSIQGGVSTRILSGSLNNTYGPIVGLRGDVALIPLIRLGLYADYEYADTTEPASSSLVSFGARVKLMIPGTRNNVHWWVFTGIGGVYWDAPGYNEADCTAQSGTGTAPCKVTPASAFFGEVPLGVGMGWRFRPHLQLIAELEGRIGFAESGSYVSQDNSFTNPDSGGGGGVYRPTTSSTGAGVWGTGTDVAAFILTVGFGFDE